MIEVTFTIHLWWIWVYLGVGAALWLPAEYFAYRQIYRPPQGFWRGAAHNLQRSGWAAPLRVIVPIVAWPLGLWELIPRHRPFNRTR